MATLVQPQSSPTDTEVKAAEEALWDAFADHLETLSPERRAEVIKDLHANGEAHAE